MAEPRKYLRINPEGAYKLADAMDIDRQPMLVMPVREAHGWARGRPPAMHAGGAPPLKMDNGKLVRCLTAPLSVPPGSRFRNDV